MSEFIARCAHSTQPERESAVINRILMSLTLLLILSVASSEAEPTARTSFYAEINACQFSHPWICVELSVSKNNDGNGAVYLSYFIHDINFAVIYHQVNAYAGLTPSMLTMSKDAQTAHLVIPAGTVVILGDEDATPYIIPGDIRIQWEAGKNRHEIDTTVTSFVNGVRSRTHYDSIVRPSVALGELLEFSVDSRSGPQYTGSDPARLSVTVTRQK